MLRSGNCPNHLEEDEMTGRQKMKAEEDRLAMEIPRDQIVALNWQLLKEIAQTKPEDYTEEKHREFSRRQRIINKAIKRYEAM